MDQETGQHDGRRGSIGTFAVRQVLGDDAERYVRSGRAVHVAAAGDLETVAVGFAAAGVRGRVGGSTGAVSQDGPGVENDREPGRKGRRAAAAGTERQTVLHATTVSARRRAVLRGRL